MITWKELRKRLDVFQADYIPEKREIHINLPEEVWLNVDTVILTMLSQEVLVIGIQNESKGKEENEKC